jgi:hypothetical protein
MNCLKWCERQDLCFWGIKLAGLVEKVSFIDLFKKLTLSLTLLIFKKYW